MLKFTTGKIAAPCPHFASNRRSWEVFDRELAAIRINDVENILKRGQLLIAAKDELERGSFEAMVKRHFDLSYARKLRIIAAHPVISNRAHVHALPPSVFTLYELTKLPAEMLREKLKNGNNDLPLFVLHDFDAAGFLIFGTRQRDTRRYQFSNEIEVIDLGLRLADIAGLEREPAAATRTTTETLRVQLAENGANDAEIAILLDERVELNAMTSDALIAMIERKLKAYGLKKVVPDDDVLAETYRAFQRSDELREDFEDLLATMDDNEQIKVPKNLKAKVQAILAKNPDLRWDDAIRIVLDGGQLDHVRDEKAKAKRKSGDFTNIDEDENG